MAFDAANRIFQISKSFPIEEKYSLTEAAAGRDLPEPALAAEVWRKRRYPAAFVSKLNDAEAEASETQVWLDFCVKCEYLEKSSVKELALIYDYIIGKLVIMIRSPEKWTI